VPRNHEFAREDKFPSWFANRIQDFLAGTETRLQLVRKSATVIEVAPDTHLGCAAVLIEGRWRFITAAIERAMSGAKGTYTIWAVAEDNLINNSPDPFTDHTAYAFDLRYTTGAAPTGTGIAVSTKIGEVDWSGSAIEALRQTHASVSGAQIANGALSTAGDLGWTREPSGAWVPSINDGAVTSRKFKPTRGFIVQSGSPVALIGVFQDVASCTFTVKPAVKSIVRVDAQFDMGANFKLANQIAEGIIQKKLGAGAWTGSGEGARLSREPTAFIRAVVPTMTDIAVEANEELNVKLSAIISGEATGTLFTTRMRYEVIAV
jgi:hypothetical protein